MPFSVVTIPLKDRILRQYFDTVDIFDGRAADCVQSFI